MFGLFKRKPAPAPAPVRRAPFLSTHAIERERVSVTELLESVRSQAVRLAAGFALDDSSNGFPQFKTFNTGINTVSEGLIAWYATQGFIGHQLAGILAQHWLINKACSMPGDDAIRNGYDVASVDGEELPPEAVRLIKHYDRKFKVKNHLRQFVRKGRIFGVRIAMFKVESTDAQYYEKPFNPDGISPNSYKGIVQIDPYWTAPMLDQASASQPDSLHFYEPTYWMINGQKVHRTHLVIFRHAEPIDILKPQYLYGGIPLPQQIMERVYAAERTANEAPQLAQTKRTNVWLTDVEQAMSNEQETVAKLNQWVSYRDNYGIKLGDKEADQFEQFDTSLSDMDALIMTQYQLVAAQAGVPSTKLLGTTPKGFNATGDYEEASYHELLETIQEHDLTPLLERHHELVMRSYVAPRVPDMASAQVSVLWEPLDSPTGKETAEENLAKAQTGQVLVQSGAISSEDERRRIATDKNSGYHGMGLEETEAPGLEEDDPPDPSKSETHGPVSA